MGTKASKWKHVKPASITTSVPKLLKLPGLTGRLCPLWRHPGWYFL